MNLVLSTIKMRCMLILVCKLITETKRLKKRLVRILKDGLALIGIIVMLGEAASEIFNYQGLFEVYKKHVWFILFVILIGCVIKNWDRLSYTVRIADSSDVTITLKVCDVLKNKGAVIIPTNSTFDTTMDDEFISKGSIQGQYQNKYFKKNLSELDKKIDAGLTGKSYVVLNDGRIHKNKRYLIGTVSRINTKNKRAYFLADSDIDVYGHPIDVDVTNISQALNGLWNELSKNGNCEPYSIPIIGTGKARAKDVSRNEVVQQTILSFLAASKEHKITESLTICIFPGDFEKIDWDGICEFLKYQSMYANVKSSETNLYGTAETTPTKIRLNGDLIVDRKNHYSAVFSNNAVQFELSERELMVLTLLTNNKLSLSEIAEAMGLSFSCTNQILSKLLEAGLIICKSSKKKKIYYSKEHV